jgi:hypothetical protein
MAMTNEPWSRTIRAAVVRLVTGSYPRHHRTLPREDALDVVGIDKCSSDTDHLERQHWDYATASREVEERYRGLHCDYWHNGGFACCHARAEPLLIWLQKRAWSEIRFGLALSIGKRLSPEEFEMLFAAVLEAEGVPRRPTLEMLVKYESPPCEIHVILRRESKGGHFSDRDDIELCGGSGIGNEIT